ncbi:MAG: hypothetical protein KGL39_25290 [Patescibacteria group bacterium]|nr:hypothetical protein [Patescibacteria group bacterium]
MFWILLLALIALYACWFAFVGAVHVAAWCIEELTRLADDAATMRYRVRPDAFNARCHTAAERAARAWGMM